MDDHVRLGARHRPCHRIGVERINDDGLDTKRLQASGLCRVAGRTDHLVLCIPQQQR